MYNFIRGFKNISPLYERHQQHTFINNELVTMYFLTYAERTFLK